MGTYEECPKCKQTFRYSSDEIDNVGTIARPIFAVVCKNKKCNTIIKFEIAINFPKNKDLNLANTNKGMRIGQKTPTIKLNPKGNAYERVRKGAIREYWVQQFFNENYSDYGFTKIDGPFDSGPDFIVTERKKRIGIEIEINWRDYIHHKHHLNRKFSIVKYLILLRKGNPTKESVKLLPEKIIYINTEKFVPWFQIQGKKYAEKKNRERDENQFGNLLQILEGELYNRYLKVCPDTERDMAICPDCELCAYKPEIDFRKCAIDFIIKYDYPLHDEEFSLSEINPKQLDNFFIKKLKAYSKGF